MKQTTISLHGSYFGNNYGDILLVNIFSDWIRAYYGGNVTINLPLADKGKTKDLPESTASIMSLTKSQALIYCGGGYFGQQPKSKNKWAIRNFLRHAIIGLLAILFRVPIAIIGVEFGPISAGWFRKIVVFIAKKSKIVVVRNEESKAFLSRYGVKDVYLSNDAVLTLSDNVSPIEPNNESPIILLHLPSIKQHIKQASHLLEFIVESSKSQLGDFRLHFIHDDFNRIYDNEEYKGIFSMLDSASIQYTVIPYEGIGRLINTINQSDYIFTTKLHVGITGAALNKRVYALYQHPKVSRFHQQISNRYCEPLEGVGASTQELIKAFFAQNRFVLPAEAKAKAERNKIYLFDFLSKYT